MVKKQTNLAIKAWIITKPILSSLLNKIVKLSYHKGHFYEINHNQGAYHAKQPWLSNNPKYHPNPKGINYFYFFYKHFK